MPAKIITTILVFEAPALLKETGKAVMHAEEIQAAQFNVGLYRGQGRYSNTLKLSA